MAFKQKSSTPTRKVGVGGLVGAVITVAVFIWNSNQTTPDRKIPADIATALTTVLTFVAAYLVSPSSADDIEPA
jgi:hypothetical protein